MKPHRTAKNGRPNTRPAVFLCFQTASAVGVGRVAHATHAVCVLPQPFVRQENERPSEKSAQQVFRRPLVRQKPRASSWDDTPCNGFGIA
ncbi:hypothetical protein HMPREF9123_2042 [Neisseria bacilliformis ATCC BAA-1200]|uniref:Uncharacterized protein n=1 Tax=Neisseria bacilliformis ATCC BAA-1200 TaxID=888742 RepID=F2BE86_9NEIS|nr:hypothetical protein HMPREF9123_2042 [Neisseria bacilliformis ATCC BAA-1200]